MLQKTGLAIVMLMVGAAAAWADATTFCVTCAGPQAIYRCEVLPPEDGDMAQSPQIFCAGEVARTNGHATCAVSRTTVSDCKGKSIVLAYTGPVTGPDDVVGPTEPQTTTAGSTSDEPKTLLEATDRAVKSSSKQIKDAGRTVKTVTKSTGETIKETGKAVTSTVGKAAKSTWGCVVSLFQDC